MRGGSFLKEVIPIRKHAHYNRLFPAWNTIIRLNHRRFALDGKYLGETLTELPKLAIVGRCLLHYYKDQVLSPGFCFCGKGPLLIVLDTNNGYFSGFDYTIIFPLIYPD